MPFYVSTARAIGCSWTSAVRVLAVHYVQVTWNVHCHRVGKCKSVEELNSWVGFSLPEEVRNWICNHVCFLPFEYVAMNWWNILPCMHGSAVLLSIKTKAEITKSIIRIKINLQASTTPAITIMNRIEFLPFFLVSIVQLSSCALNYSDLTNRTVEAAKLLVRARESFAMIRSTEEDNNTSTAWWNVALEDKDSTNRHRELAFICSHIAYLDMLSAANASGQLSNLGEDYYSNTIKPYEEITHGNLCKIWVSHACSH